MSEIEVGEYVRTKRGVGKILEVKTVQPKMYGKHDVVYLIDKCPKMYISKTEFIKHSKNIIDLIEVGDYVNGVRILDITGDYIHTSEFDCCKSRLEIKIKTIITKEQLDWLSYKVGE